MLLVFDLRLWYLNGSIAELYIFNKRNLYAREQRFDDICLLTSQCCNIICIYIETIVKVDIFIIFILILTKLNNDYIY
jgi:hypothetical protein